MTRHPFTKEQERYIEENWSKYGGKRVDMFNEKFGQSRSYDTIRTHCKRKGYTCSEEYISAKCRENAGKYVPVGTIRKSHGYNYIKISDSGTRSENWMLYHRYVYEKEVGAVPENRYLIFLDGDVDNCNIENLKAIPKSYIALLMKYHMRSEFPVVTQTGIKWCGLYVALNSERMKFDE